MAGPPPRRRKLSAVRIAVVSPHLDDAALSASAAIGRHDAAVLTVFTALPPDGVTATWWDRLTGAASSRERQLERVAEDAEAMALLGARAVHLGEPEALYRDGPADTGRAARLMTAELAACDEAWLPAAIGGHADHIAARDAGLAAARATRHKYVMLYADFPYVIHYGWPSWVTGRPGSAYLDPDFWLDDQLAAAGLGAGRLEPAVTRLSAAECARKAAAIGAYRSQAAALRLTAADIAADPAKLRYELSWRLRLDGRSP